MRPEEEQPDILRPSPTVTHVLMRVRPTPMNWNELRVFLPTLTMCLLLLALLLALDLSPQIFPAPLLGVDAWISSFLGGLAFVSLLGSVLVAGDFFHWVYLQVWALAAQRRTCLAEILMILVGPGYWFLLLLSHTLLLSFLLVDLLAPLPIFYVQIILGMLFVLVALSAAGMEFRCLDEQGSPYDQIWTGGLGVLVWTSMGAGFSWSPAAIATIAVLACVGSLLVAMLAFSVVDWSFVSPALTLPNKLAPLLIDFFLVSTFIWQQVSGYSPRNGTYWIGVVVLLLFSGVLLVRYFLKLIRSAMSTHDEEEGGFSFTRLFLGIEAFLLAELGATCLFDQIVQVGDSSSLKQQNAAFGFFALSIWGMASLSASILNTQDDRTLLSVSPLLFAWGVSTCLLFSTSLAQNWVQGSWQAAVASGSVLIALTFLASLLVFIPVCSRGWQFKSQIRIFLVVEPATCLLLSSTLNAGSFGLLWGRDTLVVRNLWTSYAGAVTQVIVGGLASLFFFVTQFAWFGLQSPWPPRGSPLRVEEEGGKKEV